jgi:hypothetical protein
MVRSADSELVPLLRFGDAAEDEHDAAAALALWP